MRKFLVALLAIAVVIFNACQSSSDSGVMSAADVEANLQKRLIEAKDGETIQLPEGVFSFKRALSFNSASNVTLKGAGMKKTVLSFKDQIEGAEGLNIKSVEGLTLEDFSISDSKGDALKISECKNVIIRRIEATWTGGKKETNGAYGLYPVFCENVLMEECEASYAMDAGIYIGQSKNVVIRNNYAHNNVAGIEIENTQVGEVYKNTAKYNTAGLLIFDMPDVPQANGFKVKIFDNYMEENNGENFSAPGIVVNTLPPGTGMLLMAHTELEVYNNTIKNHKTSGIGIVSWLFTGQEFKSKEYDPFCTEISVHDNTIAGTQGPVDTTSNFGKLFTALLGGQAYDIMIDGIYKPGTMDENGNPKGICIYNNGENPSFVNFNAGMGGTPEEMAKNMNNDMSIFNCKSKGFDLGDFDKWLATN